MNELTGADFKSATEMKDDNKSAAIADAIICTKRLPE